MKQFCSENKIGNLIFQPLKVFEDFFFRSFFADLINNSKISEHNMFGICAEISGHVVVRQDILSLLKCYRRFSQFYRMMDLHIKLFQTYICRSESNTVVPRKKENTS